MCAPIFERVRWQNMLEDSAASSMKTMTPSGRNIVAMDREADDIASQKLPETSIFRKYANTPSSMKNPKQVVSIPLDAQVANGPESARKIHGTMAMAGEARIASRANLKDSRSVPSADTVPTHWATKSTSSFALIAPADSSTQKNVVKPSIGRSLQRRFELLEILEGHRLT